MNNSNPLLSSYEEIMKLMNSSAKLDISNSKKSVQTNQDYCNQCEILNELLNLVQVRYDRLQRENYAGQLTISCLKSKNRELIKQLGQSQENLQTECSSNFQKENYFKQGQFERDQRSYDKDQSILNDFIDTFNPKQLKKILSDRTIEYSRVLQNDERSCNENTMKKSQSHNSPFACKNERTPEKAKKHFNLSQFKQKNRLYVKKEKTSNQKKILSSNHMQDVAKFQFYRF